MASPTFTYGDYTVTIATDPALGTKFAHFRATNKTKTSYSSIPKTVTYQGKTYNVVVASALDGTISSYTVLDGCFQGCTNLVSSPALPSGIDDLSHTFDGCQALATPPTIPSSVVYMNNAFYDCRSLASAPSIPAGVKDMSQCFVNCQALTIPPTIPTRVTALDSCFYGCTSLRSGPAIPASVEYLSNCFSGCSSLSGNITINANVSYVYGIFRNTVKGIWLTGSSSKLQAYADSATNSNVFVGEIPLECNLLTERVDASGATTPADEGTWVYLQLSITWANFTANNIDSISLTDNTVAASITWYADAEKTTPISLPDWHPASPVTIYGWLQIDNIAHVLTVAVSDDYHTGGVIAITVPPVFRTIDFLAGGKGIAFGKVATQEGFECAMETFFDDQVHTSFESSVAMGSYGSSQTTIPNFVDEVRYSSGAAGSVEIGTAYTKDGVTIPAGWYNFMYIPHRTGGKNGQVDPAAIDNVEYGNLLLFGFASGSGRYDITIDGGVISKLAKLITSSDVRKNPTTSTHTKNVGKIAANTYKNCETNTITPTAAQSGLTPCISGWDVSGTGTASCQIMGVYLSGNATNGYVGHIKLKNDSTSQIGDVTIEVRILWI